MTWPLPARDTPDIDAFVTDHYLEGLLEAHARGADTSPVADRPADDILTATDRLARAGNADHHVEVHAAEQEKLPAGRGGHRQHPWPAGPGRQLLP